MRFFGNIRSARAPRPAAVLLLAMGAIAALPACESLAPHPRNETGDPDQKLAIELRALERARARGDANNVLLEEEQVFVDSDHLRNNILRLSLEYPRHVPILMANAVLAYEGHEDEAAEAFLDRVLRIDPLHPDAGELRARIALERGNLPFALKTLDRHVSARPDSSQLRETFAAALLQAGDAEAAAEQLDAAETLGAPAWRVQYHRGLVAERLGRPDDARARYESSIAGNPDFAPARNRLRGLDVE